MALKIILKKEIILPDDYMSKEDFNEILDDTGDFGEIITFLEEDLMSLFGFTNGLDGFVSHIEWSDNESEHFCDNFINKEDFN